MDLRGGIYYENCLENGLKPCGWCKPTIKQQIEPEHIYQQHPDKKGRQQQDDGAWVMTRKLTRDEKVA